MAAKSNKYLNRILERTHTVGLGGGGGGRGRGGRIFNAKRKYQTLKRIQEQIERKFEQLEGDIYDNSIEKWCRPSSDMKSNQDLFGLCSKAELI